MRHRPVSTLFIIVLTVSCGHARIPVPKLVQSTAGSSVVSAERGEFIVRSVAVCGGCHSADEKNPDGALSGGKEFHNWRIGTSRASNLTPDPETGLGAWTEGEIVRAIRNGQSRNGRLLTPVMPYEWFHEMSDDDAFAVARYLKTLPAVHNEVRQSPNFIFKLGKLLFLGPKPAISATAPPRAATVEYGSYLTQHVGLCAECHTPRTGLLQNPDRSRLFAGVASPPKDFPKKPSNITSDDATGIGRWTEDEFLQTMRTGKNPSGRSLHPFMPWPELRRMTDDDLRAMYRNLKTVPPIHNDVR